jgi:hypothetical protein
MTEEVEQTAGDTTIQVVRKFKRASVVFLRHPTSTAALRRLPRKTSMSCSQALLRVRDKVSASDDRGFEVLEALWELSIRLQG